MQEYAAATIYGAENMDDWNCSKLISNSPCAELSTRIAHVKYGSHHLGNHQLGS